MQGCLEGLVHRGFVAEAGAALRDYPRYLAALRIRRERLDTEPRRDAELMARIDPLQQAWQHRVDALPPGRPPGEALVRVRWLLEEYRVSLWAQHLGTAAPVSDTRIRKLLDR
jgi:ATP-dependent helicase HrpA